MADVGSRMLRVAAMWVIVATACGGGAGYFLAARVPDSYAAQALLLAAPQNGAAGEALPEQIGFEGEPDWQVDQLRDRVVEALSLPGEGMRSGDSLAIPDLALLFKSDEVLRDLRDHLATIYQAHGIAASAPSLDAVRGATQVRTRLLMQTQHTAIYHRVIELRVTAPDPEVAAEAVNAWAERCVALGEKLGDDQHRRRMMRLEDRGERSCAALRAALNELAALDREVDSESLKSRIGAMGESYRRTAQQLAELFVEKARIEGEIAALRGRVEGAADASNEGTGDGATQKLSIPGLLEAHHQLRDRETEAAGIDGARKALLGSRDEAEAALHELRAQAIEVSTRRLPLETRVERMRDQIAVLETEDGEVGQAGPLLEIASRAEPSTAPISPNRPLATAAAAVLAGVAAGVFYFGMLALKRFARELENDARA